MLFRSGLSGQLTHSEAILIALAAFVATITPAGLWVRHLERQVWRNTVTAVAFSRRAKVSLAIALLTQGVLSLSANLIEVLILRQYAGQLQNVCSASSTFASIVAGATTFWVLGKKRADAKR